MIAGNLPYNISSPILFKLLATYRASTAACRRDADAAARGRRRIEAGPGTKDYGRSRSSSSFARRARGADAAAGRVPAGAEGPLRRVCASSFMRRLCR